MLSKPGHEAIQAVSVPDCHVINTETSYGHDCYGFSGTIQYVFFQARVLSACGGKYFACTIACPPQAGR